MTWLSSNGELTTREFNIKIQWRWDKILSLYDIISQIFFLSYRFDFLSFITSVFKVAGDRICRHQKTHSSFFWEETGSSRKGSGARWDSVGSASAFRMPWAFTVRVFALVHWEVSHLGPRCLRSPTMPSLVPCSERKIAKGLGVCCPTHSSDTLKCTHRYAVEH